MKGKLSPLIIFIAFTFLYLLNQNLLSQANPELLKEHVIHLSEDFYPRNHLHLDQLNGCSDFIFNYLNQYGDTTFFQEFEVNGKSYMNVICSFGVKYSERLIIGAHYDVCGEQPGADDNASGVAGLLELARLLNNKNTNYRIDLVAYTLEEPPFFRSENMGSFIHASSLVQGNETVIGMISLEMIGFFDDSKKSQEYPAGLLSLFYGSRGNYITLVSKFGGGKFSRKFTRKYKKDSELKAKKFKGPSSLPGIDFSDHLNYWKFGFSALMITDTAFYRNKNYHKKGDHWSLLDYEKMAKVVNGVYNTLFYF